MSIVPVPVSLGAKGGLEEVVRARLESLSYLPTTVGVAMKLVALGKDPESDPEDYAKVISSDSSLSSKLLSLANSSWFGLSNRVTKPRVAINLMGLGTVRTLAISYCLTGLHNELRLNPEESRMFWSASLCKAVAARQYARRRDPRLADEAFTMGLLQDFALPVMYVADRQAMGPMLQDGSLSGQALLARERELFHLDHAEAGRILAQRLKLPQFFVDAVAFHHDRARLEELLERKDLAAAAYGASLLPHALDAWNREDAEELQSFLAQSESEASDSSTFFCNIQTEFDQLIAYFEQGEGTRISLADLLESATKEAADHTTRLMGTVQEALQHAASAGREVEQLMREHTELAEAATRDSLTGVLNREGFKQLASEVLTRSARYGTGTTLVFMDLDHFKTLNDHFGHAAGDDALKVVAGLITRGVRQTDVVARLGGDEFVALLGDCSEDAAAGTAQRIVAAAAAQRLEAAPAARLGISAGLLWISPAGLKQPLEILLAAADQLMYEAKSRGGGQIYRGSFDQKAAAAGAAPRKTAREK
jgi:diguanylate cyclase (GGDEF)-like protein